MEDDNEEHAGQVSVDGIKLAEAHGMKPVALITEGSAGEAILEATVEQECDLVVMGAYGHGRIHELILGSTTTQVVNDSPVPVLFVR